MNLKMQYKMRPNKRINKYVNEPFWEISFNLSELPFKISDRLYFSFLKP